MSASILWRQVMAICEVTVRQRYEAPWREAGAERWARSAPRRQSSAEEPGLRPKL